MTRGVPHNLTGKSIGHWLIKHPEVRGLHKRPAWDCLCTVCGKELSFLTSTLLGHIKRGTEPVCPVCPPPVSPKFISLAGQRMAGVVVCERLPNDYKGSAVWSVRYGCGHISPRKASALRFYERHGLTIKCPQCRSNLSESKTLPSQRGTEET